MGYNIQEIQDSLSENKFDEICATYMLLGLQKQQELQSAQSLSSLSPTGGLEHSVTMTPSTAPLSPRDDTSSYIKHHHIPPPSPSTKTSSAGTPSGMGGPKKISAPGVTANVSFMCC